MDWLHAFGIGLKVIDALRALARGEVQSFNIKFRGVTYTITVQPQSSIVVITGK